jgi:L-threonylcarbamoyladenylate synthase
LEAVRKHVQEVGDGGEYVGVMAPEKWLHEQALAAGGVVIFDWGPWGDWPKLAQGLFSGLRYLDKLGASVILCPLPPENGIGMAVRDRLLRAAR